MIEGIENVTGARRLTGEDCRFFLSPEGLLMAELTDGSYRGRAYLARAFPFLLEEEYVALQNEDREEVGMIRRLSDLREEDREAVRAELKKIYFVPKIKKILSLTERFGSTHWEIQSDVGDISFTVKDTYKSMIRVGDDRLFVCDIDGCRYEIESLSGLDRKSFSKIELYV